MTLKDLGLNKLHINDRTAWHSIYNMYVLKRRDGGYRASYYDGHVDQVIAVNTETEEELCVAIVALIVEGRLQRIPLGESADVTHNRAV